VNDRADWIERGTTQRRNNVAADNGAMPKPTRIRERDGINSACNYPALLGLATNRTKIRSIIGFAIVNDK
jgi:hypothetical protein